jgi:hypothetical protein
MSPDTVVLELALLEVADAERLWQELDEQHLPVETRRKLAAQGLRAGVLGTQVPGWINSQLAEQPRTLEIDEGSGSAIMQDKTKQWRLQCRSGDSREIELGSVREELAIPVGEGDTDSQQVLKNAQCKLAIVAEPQGDGRVHLHISPEIHHGPLRHRWVGDGESFRIDLTQQCQRYPELAFAAVLAPGQTLVLAAPADAQGLGRSLFFTETLPVKHRILLLRVAQTQFDDLFSPPQTLTPIASSRR